MTDSNDEGFILIEEFRNLKNLKFAPLKGKLNLILGRNNVGKSSLLDCLHDWYKKNKTDYQIFYVKGGEDFLKSFLESVKFDIKGIFLIYKDENNELVSFSCNEHYLFEIESYIFGIKRKISLTKCTTSWPICSLKWDDLNSENKRKINFSEIKDKEELELILKRAIYWLLDDILKDEENELNWNYLYGFGELLPLSKNENISPFFEFKFSFSDPWDGNSKPTSLGGKRFIFLKFLIDVLKNKEKSSTLGFRDERKWVIFFLKSVAEKSVFLIDNPEVFLHPAYERKIFQLLKEITEINGNCDIIVTTNSSQCMLSSPSEIYDGILRLVILNEWGIVYLKNVIDKIKDPIIEVCRSYGKIFEKDLKRRPEIFYRNKWIEIFLKEYVAKIIFSKRVLFVEGFTEVNFFSHYVFNSLFKYIYDKFSKELEQYDQFEEDDLLSEEEKKLNNEKRKEMFLWKLNNLKENCKSRYNDILNKEEFWKKFNKIQIIPIFGKDNYIFFAKLSESLFLEHKFLLDDDRKRKINEQMKIFPNNFDAGEKNSWEEITKLKSDLINNIEFLKTLRSCFEEWKENKEFIDPKNAYKSLKEGWVKPKYKFFYDKTNCIQSKRNNCFCNNITWIEENFEKFIGIRKGKNPEVDVIKSLSTILKKLTEGERWRKIIKPITRESGWIEYRLCKRKEIEKYRSNE
ncbi:MAG: DNA replication and repair protein RecF [Mycoplasmataceae bacterium]|nr:MAG: DNA replication and repair protein RecF [Mycoplasmataceae bacterium]